VLRTLRRLIAASAVALAAGSGVVVPAANAPAAAPAELVTEEAHPTTAGGAAGASFGDAVDLGSMRGHRLAQPVVGIGATPTGKGYWLVARDGGIFSFGDATFFGSTGAIRLNQPIVGITPTPSGRGYWFVAADGGVFSFGDARFFGSTGAIRLSQPIVGMASTPTGKGYWLVASDGGIFAFGDARFAGSTGGRALPQPIVGMSRTPTGNGYWLVARDGAVHPFGDATGRGSAAGRSGPSVVSMASSPTGGGYWLAAADGAVFSFGDAPGLGSGATYSPVVGIARTATGKGYWLATADGNVLSTVAPPPPPAPAGAFGFLRIARDGTPVRYNPCAPVSYVVNPASAPAGGVDEVHEAFRRLGAATGIAFKFEGATDEPYTPFGKRAAYQPARYGQRWAPILVSWTSASVEALLAGGTIGFGGSTSYRSSTSDEAFVTGQVVFDTDLSMLRGGFGPGLTRGNLFVHELGHVIGLDHVDDRSQVMYPSVHSQSPDGFASGDLAGLRQLGASSGCLDVVKPPTSL
jgi:hypothetical protein